MNDAKSEWARLVVSAAIMLYFGFALVQHWTNGIEETLKSAFMILVGYWLGSSKGSTDKSVELRRQAIEPQEVTVTNEPENPVPTTAEKPNG